MNKIILILFYFLLLSNFVYPQFTAGSGTSADPYQLSSLNDLIELNNHLQNGNNWSKGKFFILTNDINDTLRFPIGHLSDNSKCFQGNINGQNFIIPIKINIIGGSANNYRGLFTKVIDGVVSGIIVTGSITDTTTNGSTWMAGILGEATNTNISFCKNLADITNGTTVAGIVARAWRCNITNCENYGTIILTNKFAIPQGRNCNIGGITAWVEDTQILNCLNAGTVYSDYNISSGGIGGGISGYMHSGNQMINCINIGSVFAENYDYVAGLVGMNYTNCTIKKCINAGYVCGINLVNVGNFGNGGVAGIIGHNRSSIPLENCINIGVIEGANIGGIECPP